MKLTDCKPGMLVWWDARDGMYAAKIVRVVKVCVAISLKTVPSYPPARKYVYPENLYRRRK